MQSIPEEPPVSTTCSVCCDSIRARSFVVRSHRSGCVRSRFRREYPHELYHSSVSHNEYLDSIDHMNSSLQWPAWVKPIGLTVLVLCVVGWVLLGVGLANSSSSADPGSLGDVMYHSNSLEVRPSRANGHAVGWEDGNLTHVNQTYISTVYNQTYFLFDKHKQSNDSAADEPNLDDPQLMNSTAKMLESADAAIGDVHNSLASLLYYGMSVFGMALIMSVVALWSSLRVMRRAFLAAVDDENEKQCDSAMKCRVRFSVITCSLLRGATLRVDVAGSNDPSVASETFIDKVRSIEHDQAALKLALATLSPSTALSLSPNPPSYAEIDRRQNDMEENKGSPVNGVRERVEPAMAQSITQSINQTVDLQRILNEQAQEIVAMKRELARMRDIYARDPHEVVLNVQEMDLHGPILIMSGQRISGVTPE